LVGTVLIVDDNEESIAAVRALFELCGVTVVAARDGADAIVLLLQGLTPGLIVLDLMMEGMDGEAFRRVQLAHAVWSEIPVAVLTGVRENPPVLAARLALPVDHVLLKPAPPDVLCALVTRHCLGVPAGRA
jgi:CheY-like chemotaxis protein